MRNVISWVLWEFHLTFLEYRFQNFLLPTIYHSVFGLNIASISPSCELKCGKRTHYLRSTKFSSLHGSNLLSGSGKKETIKELAFTNLPRYINLHNFCVQIVYFTLEHWVKHKTVYKIFLYSYVGKIKDNKICFKWKISQLKEKCRN